KSCRWRKEGSAEPTTSGSGNRGRRPSPPPPSAAARKGAYGARKMRAAADGDGGEGRPHSPAQAARAGSRGPAPQTALGLAVTGCAAASFGDVGGRELWMEAEPALAQHPELRRLDARVELERR